MATGTATSPNNWLSTFGQDGWEWDPATRQYYYHAFFREQPDLNWRNPEVQDIVTMMRAVLAEFDERLLIVLPWHALSIYVAINEYEGSLPEFAWPNWVLGNHDRDRIATRVRSAQARVAALLLLTLRGTPTIYYGEEIGMRNVPVPLAGDEGMIAQVR